MSKILVSFFVGICTAASAFAQEVVQPGQGPRGLQPETPVPAPGSYIIEFKPGSTKSARALAAAQAGAVLRHNFDSVESIAVIAPNENALNSLRNNSAVSRVVPDYVVRGRVKPGTGAPPPTPVTFDSRQLVSYEVQRVGMPATANDGTGIGIALLDTGIDFNHPDLAPAPNAAGTAFNALTPGGSCQDDGGHGTHISGLVAAQNNAIGIVGVAPAAKLYCVKVLDSGIAGTDSSIMAGLDWVAQNHSRVTPRIRVVNMSLGRPLGSGEDFSNSPLRPLIQQLYNAGVVIVAAAGNDPAREISQMVPAGFPEVFGVASTTATSGVRTCVLFGNPALTSVAADTASGFTTDGVGVTISAPGEERSDIVNLGSSGCVGLEYGVISTTMGSQGATRKLVPSLAEARGTSFSTALVTGAVARIMQKQLVTATLNAAEVEKIRTWIKDNASRPGIAPLDHPWAGAIYNYTFDGVREGVLQAPK